MPSMTERRSASASKPEPKSIARSHDDEDNFPLSFEAVAIKVGSDEKAHTFTVDTRPLTHHSRFFAVMLAKPWLESRTRTANLPEDDPQIFAIFARFIHSGKVASHQEGDVEVYADGSRRDLEWPRLARAWVLGDKLQATVFQDAVTDAICEKIESEKKWPTTLHQIIYPRTTAAAKKIRRLCVDIAVFKWEVSTSKGTKKDVEWSGFFEDLALRLMSMRSSKAAPLDFGDTGCRYHSHVAEGTKCWREGLRLAIQEAGSSGTLH